VPVAAPGKYVRRSVDVRMGARDHGRGSGTPDGSFDFEPARQAWGRAMATLLIGARDAAAAAASPARPILRFAAISASSAASMNRSAMGVAITRTTHPAPCAGLTNSAAPVPAGDYRAGLTVMRFPGGQGVAGSNSAVPTFFRTLGVPTGNQVGTIMAGAIPGRGQQGGRTGDRRVQADGGVTGYLTGRRSQSRPALQLIAGC